MLLLSQEGRPGIKAFMTEGRQHFRIKDNLPVRWSIEGGLSGAGIIFDMSASGIKLITDRSFEAPQGCIFTIEPPKGGQLPFGPKKAIMRWYQKEIKNGIECVICGLEFIYE